MRASTLYVQNWQLAADAVDYFAAENEPSDVQHFWSLSAEEQFYLMWPLLLLLGVAATRRRPQWRRRALGVVMGGLVALSFAYSLYLTEANPAAAYFVTPTRAWEFGAGGLLALFAHTRRRQRPRPSRGLVGRPGGDRDRLGGVQRRRRRSRAPPRCSRCSGRWP